MGGCGLLPRLLLLLVDLVRVLILHWWGLLLDLLLFYLLFWIECVWRVVHLGLSKLLLIRVHDGLLLLHLNHFLL